MNQSFDYNFENKNNFRDLRLTEKISVRVTPQIKHELIKEARKRGISLSDLMIGSVMKEIGRYNTARIRLSKNKGGK